MAITVLPRHDPYEFIRPVVQQNVGNLDQLLQKRQMVGAMPQGNIKDMLSAMPAGSVNKILSSYLNQQMTRPLSNQLDLARIGHYNRMPGAGSRGTGGLTANARLDQVNRQIASWRAMPERTDADKKAKGDVYNYFSPEWNKVYGEVTGGLVDAWMMRQIHQYGSPTAGASGAIKDTAGEREGRMDNYIADLDAVVPNLPDAMELGDDVVAKDEVHGFTLKKTSAWFDGDKKVPVDPEIMKPLREKWLQKWYDLQDEWIPRLGKAKERAVYSRFKNRYRTAFGKEINKLYPLPENPPKRPKPKASVSNQQLQDTGEALRALINQNDLKVPVAQAAKALRIYKGLPPERQVQVTRIIQNHLKAKSDVPWDQIVETLLSLEKK